MYKSGEVAIQYAGCEVPLLEGVPSNKPFKLHLKTDHTTKHWCQHIDQMGQHTHGHCFKLSGAITLVYFEFVGGCRSIMHNWEGIPGKWGWCFRLVIVAELGEEGISISRFLMMLTFGRLLVRCTSTGSSSTKNINFV